jgi:Uma2 family endonuclease
MAIQSARSLTTTRHRWTVDEYGRMIDFGLLGHDARIELIEGDIIDMSPIGRRHMSRVVRLGTLFHERLGRRATISVQNALILGDRSAPEPDIVLLRWRDDFYDAVDATPADVLLLIEVADSSLEYDRATKGLLYARAGILDYWITNLVDNEVEVRRDPSPEGYKSVQMLNPGDVIRPLAFPDLDVAVSDILG